MRLFMDASHRVLQYCFFAIASAKGVKVLNDLQKGVGSADHWDEPPYLPKVATQSACSCGSLIGPHSLLMRLARKLRFACTNARCRARSAAPTKSLTDRPD
jgi:hypothetical protein